MPPEPGPIDPHGTPDHQPRAPEKRQNKEATVLNGIVIVKDVIGTLLEHGDNRVNKRICC